MLQVTTNKLLFIFLLKKVNTIISKRIRIYYLILQLITEIYIKFNLD